MYHVPCCVPTPHTLNLLTLTIFFFLCYSDVIQYDPTYVAIVTLSEPSPQVEEESSSHVEDSLKLHITNNGGFYKPITSDGMQIGQVFQYIITDNSSDIIGSIKGNSFIFPQDNFTSDVLGLSLSEQILAVGISEFKIEGDNGNGGTLALVDENIVHATGNLLKYVGGRVSEWNVIATDPHHVTEATIIPEKEINNDEIDAKVGPSSFRFTSEDGFLEPMRIGDNGTMLGERFRDSVYDAETNIRIGTSQGFAFNFPKSLVPSWAMLQGKDSLPNIAIKNVFFDDGTIDILNYLVVGATGAYSQYVGWIYNETVVSINPFIADVKLSEPSKSAEEIPMPRPTPEPTSTPGPSSDATIHSCKLFAIALSTAAAVILA